MWALMAVVVTCILTAVTSVVYSVKQAERITRESEMKQCPLIVLIDDFNHSAPVTAPAGEDPRRTRARNQYFEEIHRQRERFGCPKGK